MAAPVYLTGDKAGIADFIDKFEVRQFTSRHKRKRNCE